MAAKKTKPPVPRAPQSDPQPVPASEEQVELLEAAAEPSTRGEKGCQRGGNADWHPARYRTDIAAVSEVRYCEQHAPHNHAELVENGDVVKIDG